MSDRDHVAVARMAAHVVHNPDPETGLIDMDAVHRVGGSTIWADHCPKCGRYAKRINGDSAWTPPDEPNRFWYRTDCKKCGIHAQVGVKR